MSERFESATPEKVERLKEVIRIAEPLGARSVLEAAGDVITGVLLDGEIGKEVKEADHMSEVCGCPQCKNYKNSFREWRDSLITKNPA